MSRLICRLSSSRAEVQAVAADPSACLPDGDDDLDLDRNSAGQRAHADGGARMPAALTEDFDKQIGTAVDDFGVVLEIRHRVDHPQHLYDVLHTVEIAAERIPHRCDQHEPDTPRVPIALVNRHAGAELTLRHLAIGAVRRPLPRKIEQIAGALGVDIIAERTADLRQGQPQLPQPLRNVHSTLPLNYRQRYRPISALPS